MLGCSPPFYGGSSATDLVMVKPAQRIMIFGATQGVGQGLLSMLSEANVHNLMDIHAVSRQPRINHPAAHKPIIQWHCLDLEQALPQIEVDLLVSLGPIQHALDHIQSTSNPPKAIWALSSASTDFKIDSVDLQERMQMTEILDAEQALVDACQARNIQWQLLKTTLLYGRDDHNVNRLAALIKKLRWVPVLGEGKRAPVHVDDVAKLIADGLKRYLEDAFLPEGTYRLQGNETLSYPQMLERIALRRGLAYQPIKVPAAVMDALLKLAHQMGLLKDVRFAMLTRQSVDLVVDDHEARQRLGWAPRHFEP